MVQSNNLKKLPVTVLSGFLGAGKTTLTLREVFMLRYQHFTK